MSTQGLKAAWLKAKIGLGIVGTYLYLQTGWYGFWSRTYRAIWEGRYRNLQISTYQSYRDLVKATSRLIWTADTWKQLWDAISSPQRVEYVLNWAPNKRVGDCDEFAVYNAAALNKSLKEGVFLDDPELDSALIMTLTWVDAKGKYGGHNVTLLVKDHEYQSAYSFMDYGLPSKPRYSTREVALDVLNQRAPGGTLLGYGIQTEGLRMLMVNR